MTTIASRRSICRLLIGLLVATQLAIAAYACPAGMSSLARLDQPGRAAAAMADSSRVGVDTHHDGVDPILTNLCVAHYQYGQQSADHAPAPAVPATLLISLYTLPPLAGGSGHDEPLTRPIGPLAAADPPHAILHCCLRT